MLTNHAKMVLNAVYHEYARRRVAGRTDVAAADFSDPRDTANAIGMQCDDSFVNAIGELSRAKYVRGFIRSGFILLSDGIALVENGLADGGNPVQNFNFNIQNANAPIAGTMNAQTISSNISVTNHSGADLFELERIIQSIKTTDRAELVEMLQLLKAVNNSDAPIQKNLLAKFSDVLKKHTDLIAPLGAALISIFTGG